MQVLAIDPGRDKCGIALAIIGEGGASIVLRDIWPRAAFFDRLGELMAEHAVEAFVLGDATTSRDLRLGLESQLPGIPIHAVDERNSTLEARPLYWRENPPRGLARLVPLSLQAPPRPIDDFAAQVLAQRFAQSRCT